MRNICYIPIYISISACVTEYGIHEKNDGATLTNDSDILAEPIVDDTDVSHSDIPDGTVEEAIGDDSDIPDSDNQDSDDTGHPKMDSDGNPLYPIPNSGGNDTGIAIRTPDETIVECNIPDDFMLVTYPDLDGDGFGSYNIPGAFPINVSGKYFGWTAPNFGSSGRQNVWLYSDSFEQIWSEAQQIRCDLGWNNCLPQQITSTSRSLFNDVYQQNTAFDRLSKAVSIINAEGGLPYVLTEKLAVTNKRRDFRDALLLIAEHRCGNQAWCVSANEVGYNEYGNGTYHFLGYRPNIYLTYGKLSYGTWYQYSNVVYTESAQVATFFLGDDVESYDSRYQDGYNLCDWDNDGYTRDVDCNDSVPWINPGKAEIPSNNTDNNCDGLELCNVYADLDGDGFYGEQVINQVLSEDLNCNNFPKPTDCDDESAFINPSAQEFRCNGIDENCNGSDGM